MNLQYIGVCFLAVLDSLESVDNIDYLNALRDKTLVMIGDSIMRYQYLHLVYYLEHFNWPPQVMGEGKFDLPGSVCNEKEPGWQGSFNIFFKKTNKGLKGHEVCDCYRTPGWVIENHEYHSVRLNTTVVFLWWAAWPMHYRKDTTKIRPLPQLCQLGDENDTTFLTIGESLNSPSLPFCDKNSISNIFYHFQRVGRALQLAVSDYQPHAVVINSGKHRTYRWGDTEGKPQYLSILEASNFIRLNGLDTRLIWKSTTPSVNYRKMNMTGNVRTSMRNGVLYVEPKNVDLLSSKLVQSGIFELFDAKEIILRLWDREFSLLSKGLNGDDAARSHLPNRFYWDDNHFHCWVHEELNKEMIRQLFI